MDMEIGSGFIDSLQQKYEAKSNGTNLWLQERESLVNAVESIDRSLQPRYKIVRPVNIGGTAIVLEIIDTHLQVPRALKVPRPLEFAGRVFAY
jgi:hypothetical protein